MSIEYKDGKLTCILDSTNAICVDFNTGVISVLHEAFDLSIGADVLRTEIRFSKIDMIEKITQALEYIVGDFPVDEFIKKAQEVATEKIIRDKDDNGVDDDRQDSRWNDSWATIMNEEDKIHHELSGLFESLIELRKVSEDTTLIDNVEKTLLSLLECNDTAFIDALQALEKSLVEKM